MNINSDTGTLKYRARPLIFLDLETSGLEAEKHEIMEIGAVKVSPRKPYKILGELEIKVNPKKFETADPEALKVVEYSREKWKDATSVETALKALDEFATDGILVGFNVTFDWAMLQKAYFELGKLDPFHYHRLDVLSMAYLKLYGKSSLKRFSLSNVCKVLGVERGDKHQALSDARATYLVFKKLIGLK